MSAEETAVVLRPTDRDLVSRSLEQIAERCPDPTALVYARLFSRHPEMEPLFIRDTNGAVRGEMLAKVFEIIVDLGEARRYAANMVRCEVVTHAGYGVPADVFPIFFDVVGEVVAELLGEEGAADIAQAWASMIETLHEITREAG